MAAARAAVCGSAAVCDSQCVRQCGSAAGSAALRQSVWQCIQQYAAVRQCAAVCGRRAMCGSVPHWLHEWVQSGHMGYVRRFMGSIWGV